MKDSLIDTRARLHQAWLDFLWRQWTTLGVPGSQRTRGNQVIDPEALILITTSCGRYDSRLLDGAINWLYEYGSCINLQRLGRLRDHWMIADTQVLSGIAKVLSERSILRKWQTFCRDTADRPADPAPLFIRENGSAPPPWGASDPRFLKHGLNRPPWQPRAGSIFPGVDQPANLLFLFRSLFGVNARAEVMAWLFTHEEGHPATIATETSYFAKTIQVTLNEMECSGLITSTKWGREKKFRIQRPIWQSMIGFKEGKDSPKWILWHHVYYYVSRTLMLLEKAIESADSDAFEILMSIQQRDFLREVAPALREPSLRDISHSHEKMRGPQLQQSALADVHTLIQHIEADFSLDSHPAASPHR